MKSNRFNGSRNEQKYNVIACASYHFCCRFLRYTQTIHLQQQKTQPIKQIKQNNNRQEKRIEHKMQSAGTILKCPIKRMKSNLYYIIETQSTVKAYETDKIHQHYLQQMQIIYLNYILI